MADIYVRLIVEKLRTLSSIPEKFRDEVSRKLAAMGYGETGEKPKEA